MKTAYIDCQFGVAGDMLLGALVAGGVPVDHLKSELSKLGISGWDIIPEPVKRSGIAATHVDVPTGEEHAHRHLSHITDIIGNSNLPDRVKDRATRIFTRLAEAEAVVHGTSPEKIHFHEVGALDAIVDVVGVCIGLEYFDVGSVYATPLHLGTGTVNCAHGCMPVPVPAVVELAKGVPVVRTAYDGEMTTPTGAAILTTLVESWARPGRFTGEASGYGAGTRESAEHPNTVRIVIGSTETPTPHDHSRLLETTIDDMNPEFYGYLMDQLFAAGAKDVYLTPVYMKKGRPGTVVSVLADGESAERLTGILLAETTTLGVRMLHVERRLLERREGSVSTQWGPVRVKIACVDGRERCTPEFDDCARVAREHGVPLQTVYETVIRADRNESN